MIYKQNKEMEIIKKKQINILELKSITEANQKGYYSRF